MRNFRNLIFSLLAIASLASATVLQTWCPTCGVGFVDLATWEAATTGRVDIDFASLGLGVDGFTDYSTSGGLTTGGATFIGNTGSAPAYWLYANNPALGGGIDYESGTLLKLEWSPTAYLAINLPASTFSFGVDLMSAFPEAGSFHLQVDSESLSTVTTQTRPGRTFYGVTTDTQITQIRIYFDSGVNGAVGLYDNFAYGAAGGGPPPETPEVATLLSVGSGLIALRWMRRRPAMPTASAA